MRRRNKGSAASGIAPLFWGIISLPILFGTWLREVLGLPAPVAYIVPGLVIIGGLYWYFKKKKQAFSAIEIAKIDTMSGIEVERYLQQLLMIQGYSVAMTPASGDLGVDLVAIRRTERVAIQVKRSNSKISRRAISDAVAGKGHYQCNQAMVITNSDFTTGARTLSRSTGCILIDRQILAHWIAQLQQKPT